MYMPLQYIFKLYRKVAFFDIFHISGGSLFCSIVALLIKDAWEYSVLHRCLDVTLFVLVLILSGVFGSFSILKDASLLFCSFHIYSPVCISANARKFASERIVKL